MPKYDYKPRNFAWVMRWEILIGVGSICAGLMLPKMMKMRKEMAGNNPNNVPNG
jgi:hypothetical protein